MTLPASIDPQRFSTLIRLAREEDLGTHGDITTALLPDPVQNADGIWELRSRAAGRFCGSSIIEPLLEQLAPLVRLDSLTSDDESCNVEPDTVIARLRGSVVQMLAAER